MPVEQAANRRCPKEGCVAIEDQDIAGKLSQVRLGLQYGMPCTLGVFLHDIVKARPKTPIDVLLDLFVVIAYHNVGLFRAHKVQRVLYGIIHDGLAAQRVEEQGVIGVGQLGRSSGKDNRPHGFLFTQIQGMVYHLVLLDP
jgi:hypothetical protein